MGILSKKAENATKQEIDPAIENLLEEKKAEVEAKIGKKVIAFAIPVSEGDTAFLFLTPATAQIKRRVMDKMMQSISEAGHLMLLSCGIKEESDHRFFEDTAENSDLIMTADTLCGGEIKIYSNTIKKK